MADVIKRNASLQAFSEQKIKKSIEAAAREAKLPEHRIKQVVEEASKGPLSLLRETKAVETRAIREKILSKLDVIEPSVSEAWRAFDRKRR